MASQSEISATQSNSRCGFVALIGAPNAGKSTLLNALVGTKLAIVSHKVQTTRIPIRGIVIRKASQIIFVDTPGIFVPKRRLDRAMVASAWSGAGDADLVCLLVDAKRGVDDQVDAIISGMRDLRRPCLLAITKIDLVASADLLPLAAKLNSTPLFQRTFMISAKTGSGIDDFVEELGRLMPPGPWLYPQDEITDAPMRLLAAEVTREKIFERLHQELPYHSAVETESWIEQPDGSIRAEQTIYVERESQRKIVLGKGGETIKSIGKSARVELARLIERNVHLFLFVKVRENWDEDAERYRAMGLEWPKD